MMKCKNVSSFLVTTVPFMTMTSEWFAMVSIFNFVTEMMMMIILIMMNDNDDNDDDDYDDDDEEEEQLNIQS